MRLILPHLSEVILRVTEDSYNYQYNTAKDNIYLSNSTFCTWWLQFLLCCFFSNFTIVGSICCWNRPHFHAPFRISRIFERMIINHLTKLFRVLKVVTEGLAWLGTHLRCSFLCPIPVLTPVIIASPVQFAVLEPVMTIFCTHWNILQSLLSSNLWNSVLHNPRGKICWALIEASVLFEMFSALLGHVFLVGALIQNHVVQWEEDITFYFLCCVDCTTWTVCPRLAVVNEWLCFRSRFVLVIFTRDASIKISVDSLVCTAYTMNCR